MRDENEAAGPFTVLAMLLRAPFDLWQERQIAFLRLSPVEQNLRRASQGMALVICVLIAPFLLLGWRGVGAFLVKLATHPGEAWPGAALCGALIAVGAFRFWIGTRRLAFVQDDGLLIVPSLVKLALSVSVVGYLLFTHPWRGQSEWVFFLLAAILAVAFWLTLTSMGRVGVLSWARGSAERMVREAETRREFQWDDDTPPRRWWKFWKRKKS